ncbi:MAG: AIR synthase family protein [Clostridiaceae bacterium]
MKIGKIPNSTLEKLILNKIQSNRSEVILRPGIGEDCSAVEFGKYACVLSTDPITGTANEIGKLAVHINCNDIASCGVEPIGLMVTILCPPGAAEQDLESIMDQLCSTAASINVDILGGHTEVTSAVTRFVISCTAIGRCLRGKMISTSGAKRGDSLVLTKHAGLEGASIIAREKEKELSSGLGCEIVSEAKEYINSLSVVKEGLEAARFGVNAMHDVTEGGVLGAVWEICDASGNGCEIDLGKIPVAMPTRRICGFYKIDPYKLISSGCMLISAEDGNGLVRHLKNAGIDAAVIGRLNGTSQRTMVSEGKTEPILQPSADELYKVIK